MSRSINKTTLLGNVTNEPEIRTTRGGKRVAKFGLATNRKWTGRDGQPAEKTEFHRIQVWDKLVDIVEQYVHKGDRLYVEGAIEYSHTEDDAGHIRYWTDINAKELVLLSSKKQDDLDY